MISPLFRVTGEEAKHFLPALVNINVEELREHPEWPSVRQLIDQGKIQYRLADPQEHWQTYRELVEQIQQSGVAYADCEDLASAVAAEDRARYGVMTEAWPYQPRPGLFHVVAAVPTASATRFGAGSRWPLAQGATRPGFVLQDPSAAAGMGSNFSANKGESMSSSYGWNGRLRRAIGPELGAGLREGLGLGPGWIRQAGSQLGSSLREMGEAGLDLGDGLGLGPGWIRQAGSQLGSSLREMGEAGLGLGDGLGLDDGLDELQMDVDMDGLGADDGDLGLGLGDELGGGDDEYGFIAGAILAASLLSHTKKGREVVDRIKKKAKRGFRRVKATRGHDDDDGPVPMAPTSEAAVVDDLLSDGDSEPGVDLSDEALEAEMAKLEAEFFGAMSELHGEEAAAVGEAVYGAVRSCDRYGATAGHALEDAAVAEALDHYGLLDEEMDAYAGLLSKITHLPQKVVDKVLSLREESLERRIDRNQGLMDRNASRGKTANRLLGKMKGWRPNLGLSQMATTSTPSNLLLARSRRLPAGTSFAPAPLGGGGVAPMDQVRVEAAKELTAPQVHRRIEARADDAHEAIRAGHVQAAQAAVAKIEQLLAMARKTNLKLPPLRPSTRELLQHARGGSTAGSGSMASSASGGAMVRPPIMASSQLPSRGGSTAGSGSMASSASGGAMARPPIMASSQLPSGRPQPLPLNRRPPPRSVHQNAMSDTPAVRFGAEDDGLDDLMMDSDLGLDDLTVDDDLGLEDLSGGDGLDDLMLDDELGLDELGLDELDIVAPMAAGGFRAARAELL